MKRLALIHGVNLNMLGHRPREHYGTLTLPELEQRVTSYARERGFGMTTFQTNHEGVLVDYLHELSASGPDGVIINPGAWTHYSYALRDALELIAVPVAEVHLSDIDRREDWRRLSVIRDVATVRIAGRGLEGYFEAVDALAREIAAGAARRSDPSSDD